MADLESFARFLDCDSIDSAADVFLGYGHGRANEVALSYRSHMLESGLAPATSNRRLAAVRSLIKLARVMGRINWVLEGDLALALCVVNPDRGFCTAAAVTKERPSGAMAMPSSSVGLEVFCSGWRSGKRCRQM